MICRACFLPIEADPLKVGRFHWHRECWRASMPHRPMVRWPAGPSALSDMVREPEDRRRGRQW